MDEDKIQPKRYIVSVRINDEEKEVIELMRLETSKTVSDIIREGMQMTLQRFQRSGARRHSVSGA